MERTDNLHIKQFKPLVAPDQLKADLPESEAVAEVVANARRGLKAVLIGQDPRRVVIAGPCSLHDSEATLDYAQRLAGLQAKVQDKLLIVMRCYIEKPRTTIGWKGMLYDPHLDESCDIDAGFRKARSLMLAVGELGLPVGTEFLDPIVPQYLSDLVSWAGIGARTTESQIHRQMVSGLSMPVGFKNATDGDLSPALAAVAAANHPHCFMGIDGAGQVVIAETLGNPDGHLVLRGGGQGPNYQSEYVAFAEELLRKNNIQNGMIIDCSHGNSCKDYRLQQRVLQDVAEQIKNGNRSIAGVMLESFIEPGNQKVGDGKNLTYGQSLTDACIGWDETEELVQSLAQALG